MQKNKVFVAYGKDVKQAEMSDTNDININEKNEDGEDLWRVFTFDTIDEANAFRLGLAESNGYIETYWV